MIEKIKGPLDLKVANYKGTEFDIIPAETFAMVCRKINEIIELLNAIVVDVDGIKCIDGSKKAEPADPYAEQRKWVGSLVEYKLGDLFLYGILTDIKDGYTLPFVIDGTSYTDDCWLPDESVIYHKTKGGNNE